MKTSSALLIKHNLFTLGIILSIILAEIAPWVGMRGGPLKPELTVKYGATSVIFFISGLVLTTSDLKQSTYLYKIHFLIQTFTFIFIPLFIQILSFLVFYPFNLNEWIIKGLITVSCMPPPVSSAVLITRTIGGNEATAVFNSVLGSFIGIFLTPILLLFNLGLGSTVPILTTIYHLSITVLIPLLIGQMCRFIIKPTFLSKLPLTSCGQLALLLVIYSSFCDMFSNKDFSVDAHHILLTVFLVVALQITLMYACFRLSRWLSSRRHNISPDNVIAITFCSTHKSLTLGMPLLRTLYSGYSHMAQISLPLLVYHPIQIMLGFLIVPLAQDWLRTHSKPYRSHLKA